jgi:hypothetical protein
MPVTWSDAKRAANSTFAKPVEYMIGSECEFWNKGRFSTNVVVTPDELACGVFLLKSQLPPLATVASGCLVD